MPITDGPLAGGHSWSVRTFQLPMEVLSAGIAAPDLDRALEIANSLEWVSPG